MERGHLKDLDVDLRIINNYNYKWETREVQTGCWWGDLMERGHLKDLDVDLRVINNYNNLARMGDGKGANRMLVGRLEGKRPLERPRRRFEDNIKLYLQEAGWVGVGWIDLAKDRDRWRGFESAVMNLRVP